MVEPSEPSAQEDLLVQPYYSGIVVIEPTESVKATDPITQEGSGLGKEIPTKNVALFSGSLVGSRHRVLPTCSLTLGVFSRFGGLFSRKALAGL